ncbi:MAG: MarR family transcriptional regulator [Pseudomonadales bacterium]
MKDMKLLRTVLYLHHKLERASRSFDVSISQYRMLYYLSHGPRRAAELASESSIRKPSITSLINTLESRGWISREGDPADRRAISIRITQEGTAIMKAFERHLQDSLVEYLGAEAAADAEGQIEPLFELWNDRRKLRIKQWMQASKKDKTS